MFSTYEGKQKTVVLCRDSADRLSLNPMREHFLVLFSLAILCLCWATPSVETSLCK